MLIIVSSGFNPFEDTNGRTGRVLDYTGRPNRKMCSLYLSLLDKAGVHLERFGDSNQRLAEI